MVLSNFESTLATIIEENVEKGRQEGMKKGVEKGRQEGMKKGVEKGRQEGMKKGVEKGRFQIIKAMLNLKLSDEIIIASTGIDKKELEKIKLTKN